MGKPSIIPLEDYKEEEDEEEFKSREEMIKDNAVLLQKITILSSQLSPIMDRMGRLMTDYSPHLMNEVQEFNEDIQ